MPEGTEVHANYVTMLMNKEVFGADADVFRPERFLECDDKQRHYMQKSVDLAFGHGRWLCLGKPLALIELNKIFVEVRCPAPHHPPIENGEYLQLLTQNQLSAAFACLRLPNLSCGTAVEA